MSMWVHKFFKRMISSSNFVAIARLVVYRVLNTKYSMERKSTKRRLNRPYDIEWLWTKGKGAFESMISRDHDFFFLAL